MSASFYDLLKYAETGIASPGMTAYDKMRAVAMGGGAVKTLTGVPPLSFKSNGKPLISWSMFGNGVQNGTPAPDAPIMPGFVGERTSNLYDDTSTITLRDVGVRYGMQFSSGTYSVRNDTDNIVYYYISGGSGRKVACNPHSQATVTFNIYDAPFGFFMPYNDASLGGVTIVSGNTPPDHYIPYGFQLPITNAGQTVPVYLGQVQTLRRVYKMILTGNEAWQLGSGSTPYPYIDKVNMSNNFMPNSRLYCTHFKNDGNGMTIGTNYGLLTNYTDIATDIPSWKQWLSDQYATGTPVIVWYILAEPTIGIVNEPLMRISNYADELNSTDAEVSIPTAKGANTLTVETELQPSEMTITYRG